jgi:hypothetical protein
MTLPLDRFIPRPDISDRHQITIHAPAAMVMDVARQFDLQSIPLVRAIFWLRTKLMRATGPATWGRAGLVAETLGIGWGVLVDEPDRLFIAGALCQPWQADVVFTPVPAQRFEQDATPDRVKIAWTLEAETLGPELTRLSTETRAVATDDAARVRFRRYWRRFGIGIVVIRRLLLPAVRRRAERRWRESQS